MLCELGTDVGGGCTNHQRTSKNNTHNHTESACSHSSKTLSTWPHWVFTYVCVCVLVRACAQSAVLQRLNKRNIPVSTNAIHIEEREYRRQKMRQKMCSGDATICAFCFRESEIAPIHLSIALLWLL